MPDTDARPLPPTHHVTTAQGRTIGYCSYGDPDGRLAVVVHGTPGSRYEGLALDAPARAAGLHVVVPDRPGYGRTSPAPDNGFHSWDADFVDLLDALGAPGAALVGFSGGGGYAIAAAQRHPDRVERLVLACGMIPGAPAELLARRIPLVTLLYRVAARAPRVARAMVTGSGIFRFARGSSVSAWPPADQAVMTDPVCKEWSAADALGAKEQGGDAAVADLRRYARTLPEPLSTLRPPVTFLHGTSDGNVPVEVARWAHDRIPGSTLRTLPGQGHLFLMADPSPLVEALG
ncbi:MULTISPECIES: alpha/beta fold hydrolase [unclassified Streptomyces]|uniref:alpha/beta fold hydrolase n=1 Tax=unclassified Streptomyces TaxID=2593676 RepID=UPI0036E33096